MNKYVALVAILIVTPTNAEEMKLSINPTAALEMQPAVETWKLQAILSLDSSNYESKHSSTTVIEGFPSFKECMKAGNKIAVALNSAVAAVENDINDEAPAEWGCSQGYSAARAKAVEKVSKTKAQTDR